MESRNKKTIRYQIPDDENDPDMIIDYILPFPCRKQSPEEWERYKTEQRKRALLMLIR